MKRSVVRACMCALISLSAVVAAPDLARSAACAESTSGPGLQFLVNHTPSGGTLCIDSGTYTISASLVLPNPITVTGSGPTTPVIECSAAVYCINGSAGPNDVVIQNLILQNADKADVQIGAGTSDTPVTGWTLTGLTVTGAGQVGIAMNTAADITVSNVTIERNGSIPYDPALNPTGDFGLRANKVDALTLEDSLIADNPVTDAAGTNLGFSGGAKFNTNTNLLVQHNMFTGNAGGGQLWIDISSMDFHAVDNTIDATPNAVTGLHPNEAIRVEVSCAGQGGSTIESNNVEGGDLAAIDLFDSNGVTVDQNHVVVPNTAQANYGIRMYGNAHGVIPANGCDDASGFYANRNNVAAGNDISMTDTGNALNGVENDPGGVSENNTWTDNVYTVRHCYGLQWTWWDGAVQEDVDFTAWQALGQDAGAVSGCTAVVPEIDGIPPFDPSWGPIGTTVTIHGSGMQGVTSVKFNDKAASILSTSPSAVVTSVPAGASTGPICVKALTQTRCSATDFTLAPIVSVSGVLPSSGLPGADVVITGQAFTGAADVTVGGHAASFNVASDTEIDATVPPSATTGPVCVNMTVQGTVCGADTFTVQVPSAPVMLGPTGRFQLDPFSATWTASVGATSYGVQIRSAPFNAAFPAWPVPTASPGTSVSMPFTPGKTICVLVSARDGAGSSTGSQACDAVPLDDRRLTRSRGWTRISAASFYGGAAMTSRIQNSTMTFRGVQARAISLVIEARAGGGSVDVLLNGKLIRRVSTASARVQRRKLVSVTSGTRLLRGTITIRVHTAGRPVVIDGLALSRV